MLRRGDVVPRGPAVSLGSTPELFGVLWGQRLPLPILRWFPGKFPVGELLSGVSTGRVEGWDGLSFPRASTRPDL